VYRLDVLARRDFRHHAPEEPVDVYLGNHQVRKNLAPVPHHGHAGLVA